MNCPKCQAKMVEIKRAFVCENEDCPMGSISSVQESRGVREFTPVSEPTFVSGPKRVESPLEGLKVKE